MTSGQQRKASFDKHVTAADDVVWFGYGVIEGGLDTAAELQGVHEGLRKAKDHQIKNLCVCIRAETLNQVMLTRDLPET